MKYTEAQRIKMAKAFKLVKPELTLDNAGRYICVALERLYLLGRIEGETYYDCRHLVHERLGDCYSYEVWMAKRHPALWAKQTLKKAYEGRQAWLDSLIKEFFL